MHRFLASLAVIGFLTAQEGNPGAGSAADGKAAGAANSAAVRPVRFTAFPVPECAPLEVEPAIEAALAALLRLQEGDDHDQWPYEGVYREDRGNLPVGYRVGGTAIVGLALLAAPGLEQDAERRAALDRGVRFILSALDQPRMSADFIGTYDVRGWGHIYALELLLCLQERGLVTASDAAAIESKTRWLVATLCESAIPETGGWNYSRPRGYRTPGNSASTFMTAPALQALFHARARGHEVADEVLDRALDALDRARSQAGGYAYGAPGKSQNEVPAEKLSMMDKVPGSAARATAVESTLLLAGRGDPQRLQQAVERFFAHWDDLAVRKSQTGTHVQPYGIAPYYFLYGHLYAAQAIELLPDAAVKDSLRLRMRAVLARSRDADGSWNDRHFDRSAGYGTAMAVLTMLMPTLPPPVPRGSTKG